MIVYLDILILLDFIVNFLSLYFIQRIMNDKVNYKRNIFISIIASLSIIFCLYSKLVLIILKIFGGFLVSWFGIHFKRIDKKFIQISMFYAINFALVGFLSSFKINTWYLLTLGVILILGLFTFDNYKKYFINLLKEKYNIIIDNKKLDVFIDTGNTASHNGFSVIFINQKYQSETNCKIAIKTIAGVSYVDGILKSLILICNKQRIEKKCYVCYSNIDVDCLVGSEFII